MKGPNEIACRMNRGEFHFTRRRGSVVVASCIAFYLIAAGVLVWSGCCVDVHPVDVAMIPGNTVDSNGVPSARLKARLDKSVELFQKGCFNLISGSGGTGKEGYPEGQAMRDYLTKKGVPVSAILMDNAGVMTEASAENTAAIMKSRNLKSVLFVSQYFHVPRSKLGLRKAGIAEVHGAHARFFEMLDLYSIAREIPACAKYLRK
jgi:vancomycin permeability regulator SanA